MKYIFYILIVLLLILIVFLIITKLNMNEYESFANNDYLFPLKGLQPICEEEGLFPAYMPTVCYVNGNLNSYANCKCQDQSGNCKICYPTIKKMEKNTSVIYNANINQS